MIDTPNIDLHMHSTVSDGTDTPEELLERVRQSGIEWFALTDHDSIKGCDRIRRALRTGDPKFLNGSEFSCRDEAGKYHILGYAYDPNSPAIQRLVQAGHSIRMRKVVIRLDFIRKRFGFTFQETDVQNLLSMDNPGKPHIGNLMVKYGYASSKEHAINDYINLASIPKQSIPPEMAIECILGAGGIPVLAHPPFGSGNELILGDKMDRRLRKLIGFGLRGVEGFYSGFTPMLQAQTLAFAEKYGLYVTAGSDYHGTNKLVSLGKTHLSSARSLPKGLKRFLEDVDPG